MQVISTKCSSLSVLSVLCDHDSLVFTMANLPELTGPSVNHIYEVVLDEEAINEDVDNITLNIYWPHRFPNDVSTIILALGILGPDLIKLKCASRQAGKVHCSTTEV